MYVLTIYYSNIHECYFAYYFCKPQSLSALVKVKFLFYVYYKVSQMPKIVSDKKKCLLTNH